jgi:hypothetical protein
MSMAVFVRASVRFFCFLLAVVADFVRFAFSQTIMCRRRNKLRIPMDATAPTVLDLIGTEIVLLWLLLLLLLLCPQFVVSLTSPLY